MNIIVTGSLGHIGKPLTENLVSKGHRVTVISSNEEKKDAIEALGAVAAIGTLEDVPFLTKTFESAEAVFTMVPPNFAEMDQMGYYKRIGRAFANAIESAGVKHVVNLSSYGAHLDKGTGFILGAHHTETILDALPEAVAVTQLRPGYFYYNLFNFTGMLKGAGIIGSNFGGDDKMVLVDPADIAVVAAEELTAAATGRKVRYIASDERTADEVAGIIGAAIGKPGLTWLTFTNEQAQSGMEGNGVPAPIAAMFTELGASLHSGALLEDYEAHRPAEMGRVRLEDFAKEFAEVYSRPGAESNH